MARRSTNISGFGVHVDQNVSLNRLEVNRFGFLRFRQRVGERREKKRKGANNHKDIYLFNQSVLQ